MCTTLVEVKTRARQLAAEDDLAQILSVTQLSGPDWGAVAIVLHGLIPSGRSTSSSKAPGTITWSTIWKLLLRAWAERGAGDWAPLALCSTCTLMWCSEINHTSSSIDSNDVNLLEMIMRQALVDCRVVSDKPETPADQAVGDMMRGALHSCHGLCPEVRTH
jgi:hypothetical protein